MFFCMSKIINDNKTFVSHGKGLNKNIADSACEVSNDKSARAIDYLDRGYKVISWIDRADKPHKCNIESCPLFRLYLRDKFWTIGFRALMYNESKKILTKYLPNDIVIFILKKCFRK